MFGGNLLWNVAKSSTSEILDSKQSDIAIVYSVILDETHPEIQTGKLNISDVGSIQCRLLSDIQNNELIVARPLDSLITILPIRNQTVFVQKLGSEYVYTQISKGLSPNTSNASNIISKLFPGDEVAESGAKSKKYSDVQSTGISRSSVNEVQNLDGFGDYFQEEAGIHKLKLYEGDILFQSRFGQSLRFSGYNNSENSFSPTLILRNGESPLNRQEADDVVVEEDVNNDGNIIFLGSGQRLLDYILPVDNSYQSFFNYPSELRGNQILLNSDRIILSAKNAEMIGVAKKDIGFITDGQFSIDATAGINVTTDASIFVDTTDRDFNIDIGNGTVFLGTDGELEAAPKGETLVELLGELIDLIAQQIYLTPSGPTAAGPTNVAEFSALKSKLNSILSNNVQLK